MLNVLCKNKINPEELTLEDFKATHKLIAMYPEYYRALLGKNDKEYILTLDDFDDIDITEENLADYQALLYDTYGMDFDEDEYDYPEDMEGED